MSKTMWKVLQSLIRAHFEEAGFYRSVWSLSSEIGIDLAGCGVPEGDPALEALVKLGLIEEVPDLHCRYQIVITPAPTGASEE